MKLKRILMISLAILICAAVVEFAAGPHIYSTVKDAMQTKEGYTASMSKIMTKDEFNWLNPYDSYSDLEVQSLNAELKLFQIASVHNFKTGYVWMKYTLTITDKTGEEVSGSWHVPIKFAVKKIDGQWYITKIYEAP